MGQSRPFASYDLSASKLVSAVPCSLIALDGNYSGGGAEYLQVFDKATAPVANDIPIKSMLLSAAGPLPSLFDVISPTVLFNGLGVGISSVNEKYTASASAYDVFGQIEEYELSPLLNAAGTAMPGYTIAGDLTSNVQSLQVWNTGAHNLCRVEVTTPANGPWYMMIFAKTTLPTDGVVPTCFVSSALSASTAYKFDFGHEGRWIMDQVAGVNRTGCIVCISDAVGSLSLTLDNHKIRAIYK